MSVTVVALLAPKPGMALQVIESFREVSPLVHHEPGCELYAAHTDGSVVIMVESWTTQEDLAAHAAGAPLARLNELNAELLVKPYDVWMLDNVPLGEPTRGTIPVSPLSTAVPGTASDLIARSYPASIVADRVGGTPAGRGA